MLKFICKENNVIYINPTQLCQMDNLKNTENFQSLFSDSNLSDRTDKDECLLLKNLDITSTEWLEFMSFIKHGVPMYYTLDIFNDPNKKDIFVFNLEKLNKLCIKLGGIKKFDDFYIKFLEKSKNIEYSYNPQEPSKDYKKLYQWGIGFISTSYGINLTFAEYNKMDGWSTGKTFIKNKETYIWYKRDKKLSTQN